jgi:serine/threonine protein kinase
MLGRALADRYRIERELGQGGMATVYLAEDVKHHRKVAVKVLRRELAQSLGRERFLREVHVAAQLYHPHILPLIDSGVSADETSSDGVLYYVMPYVEGESLRTRLARDGALSITDSVRILRDVASALAYAHERGVVHRDIKPENVLLAGRHALVADFGVAKAVSAAGGAETLTSAGLIVGTPAYMAPEQAAGEGTVDHRADIYAIGVLGYELLAGTPPFAGLPVPQLLAAHLTRTPEPLTALRQTVPSELDQVVMTCLAKRPADRWQTAADLLARLEALSDAARGHRTPRDTRVNDIHERTYRLSEGVCRKLTRATLDPRMIGDAIQFLDNEVESDVLVCYVHPTSLDHWYFKPILQTSPYRGIAPTLYGFEPAGRRGIHLSLDDHIVVLREFLRDAVNRLHPSVTLLVGFSSGSDIALRLVDAPESQLPLPIDGLLSLSCNLSLETCFVTSILARMNPNDPARLLADLRTFGTASTNLDDWVDVHEYLVRIFRKFHGDIGVLQRFASDLVRPFAESGEATFVRWFRTASARLGAVRCVFESTGVTGRAAQALRLRNLDTDLLGPHYREDSIVIESDASHFELMNPVRLSRHIDDIVARLRRGAERDTMTTSS